MYCCARRSERYSVGCEKKEMSVRVSLILTTAGGREVQSIWPV